MGAAASVSVSVSASSVGSSIDKSSEGELAELIKKLSPKQRSKLEGAISAAKTPRNATMDETAPKLLLPRCAPKHGGNAKVPPEQWAMTITQFDEFLDACMRTPTWEEIKKTPGFGSKIGFVNGYDLNDKFVKPWTAGTGSGVALNMNAEKPVIAEIMLSHAWAEDMMELQEALTNAGKASIPGYEVGLKLPKKKDTAIWFCIHANYQCEDGAGPTITEQLARDPFGKVIEATQTMACVHTSRADMYTRLWCVYELWAASDKFFASVHVICSDKYLEDIKKNGFQPIDSLNAQVSSPSDNIMIRSMIETGGIETACEAIKEHAPSLIGEVGAYSELNEILSAKRMDMMGILVGLNDADDDEGF